MSLFPDRPSSETKAFVRALAYLPRDAEVTITVKARDLAGGIVQSVGGPGTMSTEQAAEYFGYTPDKWRAWAHEGFIRGAWQDEAGGQWRLPREGCFERVQDVQAQGVHPPFRSGYHPKRTTGRTGPRGPYKKSPFPDRRELPPYARGYEQAQAQAQPQDIYIEDVRKEMGAEAKKAARPRRGRKRKNTQTPDSQNPPEGHS